MDSSWNEINFWLSKIAQMKSMNIHHWVQHKDTHGNQVHLSHPSSHTGDHRPGVWKCSDQRYNETLTRSSSQTHNQLHHCCPNSHYPHHTANVQKCSVHFDTGTATGSKSSILSIDQYNERFNEGDDLFKLRQLTTNFVLLIRSIIAVILCVTNWAFGNAQIVVALKLPDATVPFSWKTKASFCHSEYSGCFIDLH